MEGCIEWFYVYVAVWVCFGLFAVFICSIYIVIII